MKYLRFNGDIVAEIIPAENPAMPGVPIERRYPASYIAQLVKVSDDVEVHVGWRHRGDGTFEEVPHTPMEEPPVDVESIRTSKLAEVSTAGNAAIVSGVDVTLPNTRRPSISASTRPTRST